MGTAFLNRHFKCMSAKEVFASIINDYIFSQRILDQNLFTRRVDRDPFKSVIGQYRVIQNKRAKIKQDIGYAPLNNLK